ncbi:MAG: hypothetical protein NTY30_01740 [Candidatus Berkelbacteria bacterium]|nr:hypothetical protein [Candidatus Berkelbacteria bacterium]
MKRERPKVRWWLVVVILLAVLIYLIGISSCGAKMLDGIMVAACD